LGSQLPHFLLGRYCSISFLLLGLLKFNILLKISLHLVPLDSSISIHKQLLPLKLIFSYHSFPLSIGSVCISLHSNQQVFPSQVFTSDTLLPLPSICSLGLLTLPSICPLGLRLSQYLIQLVLGLVLLYLSLSLHLPYYLHHMAGHFP